MYIQNEKSIIDTFMFRYTIIIVSTKSLESQCGMDVQKIYQIFLYNTMSHKTIGGVYMVMNGIYLVIASACILI